MDKKSFVTFVKPDRSQQGVLENKVNICLWDYHPDTGVFDNSTMIKTEIETRIPTYQCKQHEIDKMKKSVKNYRQKTAELHKKKLFQVREELDKSRPGTKKYNQLKNNEGCLERFLSDINNKIRLEGPYPKYDNKKEEPRHQVYHLVTPFFNKNQIFPYIHRAFHRAAMYHNRTAQICLSFRHPFALAQEQGGKYRFLQERLETRALARGRGLGVDFETADWQTIRLFRELIELPEEQLKQKYLEIAELNNKAVDDQALELMDRKAYIRGIEEIVNENRDERITVGVISNLEKDYNYLVTTLDCGKDRIMIDVPGTQKKKEFRIIKAKDQQELIGKHTGLIQDFNPLWVYGHNQFKFDYAKVVELAGSFKAGVEDTNPVFISQAAKGFVVQRILPGRLNIDGAGFAQHYLETSNNKQDTVYHHITGFLSPKTINYLELTEHTARAEKGDKEAARTILYYTGQDGMKTLLTGEKLKEPVAELSKLFASPPSRICTVSKKTLSEDYWVRRTYIFKHTNPYASISAYRAHIEPFLGKGKDGKRLRRILRKKQEAAGLSRGQALTEEQARKKQAVEETISKLEKQQKKQFRELRFDEFESNHYLYSELEKRILSDKTPRRTRGVLEPSKGLYQGAVVSLMPFQKAFKEIIIKDSEIEDVYKYINKLEHKGIKRAILLALEEIAEYPLFYTLDQKMQEKWFSAEFQLGFSKQELQKYRALTASVVDETYYLLSKHKPLNMNKDIFLLSCEKEQDYKDVQGLAEQSGLGVVMGSGRFLSGTRGRFAGNIRGELFMKGIADPKSKKKYQCEYEQSILNNFIQKGVMEQDLASALEHVRDQAALLRQGKITSEELLYEYEAKKDHDDYTARAHASERVQRIQEQRAHKGDLVIHEYTYEQMLEKLFGIKISGKRTRKKGSVSEIIEWVFDFKKDSPGDENLRKIYLGQPSTNTIDQTMHYYEFTKKTTKDRSQMELF